MMAFILDFFTTIVVIFVFKNKQAKNQQAKNQHIKNPRIVFSVCVMIFLGLIFGMHAGFSLLIAVKGQDFLIPFLQKRNDARRCLAFDRALASGLVSVATSLRSGLTLRASVALAAQNGDDALKEEWQRAIREADYGERLDRVLLSVSERIPTWASRMAMHGMALSLSQGGKLPELLLKIAHTISETQRVEGRLRTLTAQGRSQAFLLIGAPPAMAMGMWFFDRTKANLLLSTAIGQVLTVSAILLWISGIYLTKKTMEFNV